MLTKKDTYLNRGEFQQLIFASLPSTNLTPIKIPIPAILKPRVLWTGKQVISAILDHIAGGLPPLNLKGNTRLPGRLWIGHPEEGEVVIHNVTITFLSSLCFSYPYLFLHQLPFSFSLF